MPTLEEELEALKSALSLLQTRHISDVKQLSEQILLLQQQIDDQKKRSLQIPAINQGFLRIEQRIDQLERKIDQQTIDLRQKFDASDHFAAKTWGLAQEQERDIREMKISLSSIDDGVTSLALRFSSLELRSESQDNKLDQVLLQLTTLATKIGQ